MRYFRVKVLKRLRDSSGQMREAGTEYVVPENIANAGESAGLLKIIEEVAAPGEPQLPHDPEPVTTTVSVDTDGDGVDDFNVEVTVDLDPIRED